MYADLRQTVNVGFTGAKIAALYRVVEQAENAVAIVLIILGRVDAALRRDGVGASRRVLKTEALDLVTKFAQARRGGGARQTGSHNNDFECLRLFAGFTSFISKRALSHLSSIGPEGIAIQFHYHSELL